MRRSYRRAAIHQGAHTVSRRRGHAYAGDRAVCGMVLARRSL